MSNAAQSEYSNQASNGNSAGISTTPTRSSSLQTPQSASLPPSAGSMASYDYTSPTTYMTSDTYSLSSQPHTPLGPPGVPHEINYGMTDMSLGDGSYPYGFPGEFEMDFSSYGSNAPMDHSTPSAPTTIEDDRTPVVSDTPNPIPPSALPRPSDHMNRSVHMSDVKPLMSPFRPLQHEMMYPMPGTAGMPQTSPTYYDPSTAMYHQVPNMNRFYDGSPVDQTGFTPGQLPPQFATRLPLQPPPQVYPNGHIAPSASTSTDFGPSRSRNGSPTSTISSSAASLTRSTSTSSELRTRPKVKLSFQDKKSIVELHRSNNSLRQEDIAKQYGVDRSTISKIIISSHRWTQEPEVDPVPVPKAIKVIGGRFPAIEEKMHEWMDREIAAGRDVKDNIARDQAKLFAKEIGFPMDRFKASAKWLDKFKDRRRATGRPISSALNQMAFAGYYPYSTMPYTAGLPPGMSPMTGSTILSRSQSTLTLSSSDSSGQDQYQASPAFQPSPMDGTFLQAPQPMLPTRSESDLLNLETTPSRQRSQSSPQLVLEPGNMSPSSGKALRIVRPTPLSLHRQNSYHGTSPSPRRPAPLSRANSSQGVVGIRKTPRPTTSLAASAFGITPLGGDEAYSPLHSPSTSGSSGTHSRQRSDTSLTPYMSSLGVMSISPDMSEGGDMVSLASMGHIPPMTPITPHHVAGSGVFQNTDYGELQTHEMENIPHQHAGMGGEIHHQPAQPHFSTMPNKHYVHHQPYPGYPTTDFGPAYRHIPHEQSAQAWQ